MIHTKYLFPFKSEKEKFDQNNKLVYSFIERLSFIAKNEIKHPEYSNLITIFFHEIVTLYSNSLILKNSSRSYNNLMRVPFLNSKIVTEFDSTKIQDYNFKPGEISKSTFGQINEKINWFRSNKISLSPNFPKYHIHKNLIDFLKIPVVLPKNPQIFIEDAKIQLLIIEEFLKNEFDKIQIKSIQIIKLFRNYIKFYLSKDEFELTGSLFLTGSNTNIISRIMSANFRKKDLPVISVCHGEHSIRVFNEPLFNYAELTLSTHYIDYGERYNSILPQTDSKVIYRSSEKIKNIKNTTTRNPKKKGKKILYIPTSYSLNNLYGPYRSFEDHVYIEWQQLLMKYNEHLMMKIHPKSKVSFQIFDKQQITGTLEKFIETYDRFVFDYISSAFALSCATGKPILYFDLGIRNLNKEAKAIIKKRCYYCEINYDQNIGDQIQKAFSEFDSFNNYDPFTYSDTYSLNKMNDLEYDTIFNLVKNLRRS